MKKIMDLHGQLLHIRREMAAILQEYNSCLPVSRLPEDVLHEILSYTPTDNAAFREEKISMPDPPPEPQIPSTAHVCSFWRTVATRTPPLWNIVNISHPAVSLALYDHFGFPVRVCTGLNPWWKVPASLALLQRVIATPSRIMELDIGMPAEYAESLIFPGPAHILQRLLIRLADDYIDPAVHRRLAALDAPNLSHLELQSVHLTSWTSPLLSSVKLRHLKLDSTFIIPRPSLPETLDALQRFRQLEFLELHHALPVCSPNSSPMDHDLGSQHTLDLPTLRKVDIKGAVLDCLAFVQCLVLSPRTALLVEIGDDTQSQNWRSGFKRLWDAGTRHSARRLFNEEISLRFSRLFLPGLRVECFVCNETYTPVSPFTLSIDTDEDWIIEASAIDLAYHLADLKPTCLILEDLTPFTSPETWPTILFPYTSVRDLVLEGQSPCVAIARLPYVDRCLPNLTSLTFGGSLPSATTEGWFLRGLLRCCLDIVERRNGTEGAGEAPSGAPSRIERITFINCWGIRGYEEFGQLQEQVRVVIGFKE